MFSIVLLLLLVTYFLIISCQLKKYIPEKRTIKIAKLLSKIIKLSPLIGIVIFAILFAFVLKGRFLERVSHALLVFAIWLYATQFYQYILAYFKKKTIFIGSIVGITFSIILAVVYTPLDRYISLIYSYMNWCSIFLSCGLFVLFYTESYVVKGSKTDR